ncbi:hypothetical protein [Deinococcus enclensis]|uniref:Uncharacterized protein n=1 Tax=Deinococcus enclensis TaxID=1049582 RepID=A0ABT9M7Q0_9DEIO|nr:hypothetical protein [Deinococcus enclensis]MDP9762593.1 hypothetical protein [Deinococcus enclensis]
MSCVLRAAGTDFDVDGSIARVQLPDIFRIYRKGTRDRPSQPRPHEASGLNVVVSDAEFTEVDRQIEEALHYLEVHTDALRLLAGFPRVLGVVLDFGIEDRDVGAQADYFPPDLLRALGDLNIGLVVSRYPRPDEEDQVPGQGTLASSLPGRAAGYGSAWAGSG